MNSILSVSNLLQPSPHSQLPSETARRPVLRRLLRKLLRGDADLNAFCLDYFPEVHRRFADGMDRMGKVNLLLEQSEPIVVLAQLRKAFRDDSNAQGLIARHLEERETEEAQRALELRDELDRLYLLREQRRQRRQDTAELDQQIVAVKRNQRQVPELQEGEVLDDRYRLLEIVGRGGFAYVWQAFDRIENRIVAVKVLHRESGDRARRLERFTRGARRMKDLEHPHIVRVLDGPKDYHGFHYFVMDYLPGGDLFQSVTNCSIDRAEALQAILDVCDALAHAHAHRLIHRDVKPQNILLDIQNKARLTDFDLVWAADTTGGTGTGFMGTYAYVAPEQAENAKTIDERADIYALGMTTLFVLNGRALSSRAIFQRALFIDDLRCSDPTKALLRMATAIDPEDRPQTISAFYDSLARSFVDSDIRKPVSFPLLKNDRQNIAAVEEEFKRHCELAETYSTELQNYQKAIASLLEALDLKPENYVVLHKILELYTKTEQWKNATEILSRLICIEREPRRRGKYYYTAGIIYRDALQSVDEALYQFNKALDSYFEKPELILEADFHTYLKPFEAIDKICTNRKDWKAQEGHYRKMIKRMPTTGQDQVTIALWHALGEIYRSRLRDINAAIKTFEVAAQIEPDNLQRREILAELYIVSGPDFIDKALREQMFLIENDPYRVDSYKALRRIYMSMHQYDKAWCVCSALTYLHRADEEESQFFEQYQSKGLMHTKVKLTDDMWRRYVYHPDQDRFVSSIYAAVYIAVGMMKSSEHKLFGLKRKQRRDLSTEQTLVGKVFTYLMQALNVPSEPEIFFRPDQIGELQLANCREKQKFVPSIMVGQGLLTERSDKHLALPIAVFLTKIRPEHYLREVIQNNTDLSIALMAAIRLVAPQFSVPLVKLPLVEQYIIEMRPHLSRTAAEHLQTVVQQFLQTASQLDMSKWVRAVELTSHRAGFIIANDLSLAAGFIESEPSTNGGMMSNDKIKELMMYAVSPQYFELRKLLGITIGIGL